MSHLRELQGRIALVTSAATARLFAAELATRGATVVVADSDAPGSASLAARIAQQTGNPNVHPLVIDLTSLPSVRRAARDFLARYDRLHVLVSDTTVAHLGPFLLANLLLDTMKRSGGGRIIRVVAPSERQEIWSATSLRS